MQRLRETIDQDEAYGKPRHPLTWTLKITYEFVPRCDDDDAEKAFASRYNETELELLRDATWRDLCQELQDLFPDVSHCCWLNLTSWVWVCHAGAWRCREIAVSAADVARHQSRRESLVLAPYSLSCATRHECEIRMHLIMRRRCRASVLFARDPPLPALYSMISLTTTERMGCYIY